MKINKKRLAVVTTHPIQYYAPLFRLVANEPSVELMVFYTWGEAANEKYDPGFGKVVSWDIPVLSGYQYTFLRNTAKKPGTQSFFGISNPDIIQKISEWKPEYLLVFGWSWKSHLQAIRYFHGKIPIWFRGDSHLLDPVSPVKSILRRVFLRWVYSHIDHAFAVGTLNRDYFLWAGLKENQISIMPHTVEVQRFATLTPDQEKELQRFRESLSVDKAKCVFLFAGKFQKKKGIADLVTAFKAIPDPSIRLILIGSGELEYVLKETSKTDNRIIFLPFQNQTSMPVLYRLSHWFVYPSQGPGETWGLAVNEALASGVRCIVSDKVGCHPDLIQGHDKGFVFPSGNINQLKEVLLNCIASSKNGINRGIYQNLIPKYFFPEESIKVLLSKLS